MFGLNQPCCSFGVFRLFILVNTEIRTLKSVPVVNVIVLQLDTKRNLRSQTPTTIFRR